MLCSNDAYTALMCVEHRHLDKSFGVGRQAQDWESSEHHGEAVLRVWWPFARGFASPSSRGLRSDQLVEASNIWSDAQAAHRLYQVNDRPAVGRSNHPTVLLQRIRADRHFLLLHSLDHSRRQFSRALIATEGEAADGRVEDSVGRACVTTLHHSPIEQREGQVHSLVLA